MKKLPLILLFCLLLVGCGQKNPDPVVIHAPNTSAAPKIDSTAAPETKKSPDTATSVVIPSTDTFVPIDTKKPIVDDVGNDTGNGNLNPVDAQTTGVSDTETTQSHIVPGVPMSYRATVEADGGTYLLDADYHLSFVKNGDDPVFHETDTSVKKGVGTVVYCSDLNVSVLLDAQNVPITVNAGKMVRVGADFLICYPKANAEMFALCDSDTGEICTEAVMRGYQTVDEPDSRLVLLGKESICHFDGHQICYENSFDLIYYFSADFLLVRENGQLRLYNLAMNALADWGEISMSNTMRFGDTKREGDAITFVYKNGSYTYNPANTEPIPFTDVLEGESMVLEKQEQFGTYFVRNKTGKVFHTAVSLPDVNYVYMGSRDNSFVFIDEKGNYSRLSKENGIMVCHTTPAASIQQFSYAGFKAVNADGCAFLMDGENNVLMWSDGMNYASMGEFLLCCVGDDIVSVLNSELTAVVEEDGGHYRAALNEDGTLVVFRNNQYRVYAPDGNRLQEKTVSGQLLAFAGGRFLKSENGKVSLMDTDGNDVCEPVDCDTDLTFVSAAMENTQWVFRFYSQRNQGDVVFICTTENGKTVITVE